MAETLLNIHESPSQKPILKPSSFDIDSSPIHLKPSFNQQHSFVQTSLLDSTQHASFLLPPSDPPSSKVRFNRAYTTALQDPFNGSRKRSTSTNIKINRSVLGPSSLLDESVNLPQTQLNISFQDNRKDSIDQSLLEVPALTSFLSTPAGPLRARSQTVAVKPRRPTMDIKRKSIVIHNKERSFTDKVKLQPIENTHSSNLEESKRPPANRPSSNRPSRQNSILRQVIGSSDPLKKDRFVRFFENSVKRVFKMTEPIKKNEKESKGLKDLEKFHKELKRKYGEKVDKELRSESLDEVKELSRDDKEEKRKDMAEFVIYKEINEMVHFCARENSIYIFLKAMKLLGVFYLHYEKLDEAFFCFCQLRWASEYLGMYKAKSSAFFKMAECCKLVENYDEAIKLLRKSLQYSWEYNLVNREMKIYDLMGKLYYLKGEIKKAQYYNERFSNGISEPKDSPLREKYNQLLIDNKEQGRYGNFTSLDLAFMTRISFPFLPSDFNRRSSVLSSLSSLSLEEQKRKELDERPKNVKKFQEQLSVVITDSELVLHRKPGEGDEPSEQQEGPEMIELPSPSFKANFAELDSKKTNEQKLRDLKLKEERLYSVIRNAKRELGDIVAEDDRKKSMHNIFELQIAFQREKRLILGQQQAYRIHLAKLWKSQYHVFENKKKPEICRTNIKTESNIVMENKFDIALDDPDFFHGVLRKVVALRSENNLPPFALMTHKKMPQKPMKKDKTLLNESAKKIYLKFKNKLMKKIDPGRVNKFSREESS